MTEGVRVPSVIVLGLKTLEDDAHLLNGVPDVAVVLLVSLSVVGAHVDLLEALLKTFHRHLAGFLQEDQNWPGKEEGDLEDLRVDVVLEIVRELMDFVT